MTVKNAIFEFIKYEYVSLQRHLHKPVVLPTTTEHLTGLFQSRMEIGIFYKPVPCRSTQQR